MNSLFDPLVSWWHNPLHELHKHGCGLEVCGIHEFISAIILNHQIWGLISAWGAFPLVFVLEKLFPAREIPWLASGWVSDLMHMYEPWLRAFVFGGFIAFVENSPEIAVLRDEVRQLAPIVQFVILLLSTELVFYLVHRVSHCVPFLWEFHKVHHSSTVYYSLMTKRFHIVDLVLFGFPTIASIAFIGAEAEVSFSLLVFRRFMDVYGHSNINSPKLLILFLVTPHYHAWHHSRHDEAVNKNFGRDVVLFDYLFGTAFYPRSMVPTEFGYSECSNNYFVQQLTPFYCLYIKIRRKLS